MKNKGFYTILDPKGRDIGLRIYDEEDAEGVIRWYRNQDPSYAVRKAVGFTSIKKPELKELAYNTWYWSADGAGHRTSVPTTDPEYAFDVFAHNKKRNVGEMLIAITEWELMPLLGRFGTESGSVVEGASKEGE